MSVKIMAAVWEHGPDDLTELLVLLCIADHANDQGVCWPAMQTIAKKCRLTERGARKVIRRLEQSEWLSTSVGGGRGGANIYTVNPERCSPRNGVPPGTRVQETRNGGSAEPSRTINNPPNPPRGGSEISMKSGRRAGVPDGVYKLLGRAK